MLSNETSSSEYRLTIEEMLPPSLSTIFMSATIPLSLAKLILAYRVKELSTKADELQMR